MFRASIGFLFSLLGFLPQLGQITQGIFGFGSFGDNVNPVQGIPRAGDSPRISGV